MTYGSETLLMKKIFEKKINVEEMKMLRWMAGIPRLDKVRDDLVRGATKVTEVSKKIQEKKLHWFGHVMRRDQEEVGRRMLDMDVPGRRRRETKEKVDGVCNSRYDGKKNLTMEDRGDRRTWKRLSRNSDPAERENL
ncbi:uncharacterized protein [Palaemon carinicauda]|uniref:uncharacterized protein n=1 Tax=Palaemon carinicauda TaxID=392227 RepID=UPI0035B5D182